jgi:hypothetical protein
MGFQMVTIKHFLALIIAIAVILPAASAMVGGDKAWFLINSNVDGADVYFGGEYKGQTVDQKLYVEYYTTGTPVTNFMVTKDGYTPYTGQITHYPAMGETVDLYATLQPAQPTPEPAPIGGSIGWYTIYANVDDANVYFDNDLKGTITNGELTVQVYATATPYQTFRVSKAGYSDFTSQITDWPAAGETVKLHANLQPVAPTQPQPSPVSVLAVLGGAVGAAVLIAFRRK